MKINDKIISSLQSLKVNFDLNEIWDKREIAIRDLSPDLVHYPDKETRAYYYAFAHPQSVSIEDGAAVLHQGDTATKLNLNIADEKVKDIPLPERIQLLALHKLAGVELAEGISESFNKKISLEDDVILLENGQSIPLSKCNNNNETSLIHKAIIVAPTSTKKSKVGNYLLEPGQGTYGIFSNGELMLVVPPYDNNASYHFEYELVDGTLYLMVKDVSTNTLVAKYRDAHCYAPLGDNNFVVITGSMVSSFNNEDLNNRLRQNIVKSKSPEYVFTEGKLIKVVYKNNFQETIEI